MDIKEKTMIYMKGYSPHCEVDIGTWLLIADEVRVSKHFAQLRTKSK